MAEDLIFYTNPMSRGRIGRWMLEETGVSYETRLLDFDTTMKADDYLKVNPMGKVPSIVHRGTVVTECAAICAYLADAFPDAGLAPPPEKRGAYYRWLFFAAGPHSRPMRHASRNGRRSSAPANLTMRPCRPDKSGPHKANRHPRACRPNPDFL